MNSFLKFVLVVSAIVWLAAVSAPAQLANAGMSPHDIAQARMYALGLVVVCVLLLVLAIPSRVDEKIERARKQSKKAFSEAIGEMRDDLAQADQERRKVVSRKEAALLDELNSLLRKADKLESDFGRLDSAASRVSRSAVNELMGRLAALRTRLDDFQAGDGAATLIGRLASDMETLEDEISPLASRLDSFDIEEVGEDLSQHEKTIGQAEALQAQARPLFERAQALSLKLKPLAQDDLGLQQLISKAQAQVEEIDNTLDELDLSTLTDDSTRTARKLHECTYRLEQATALFNQAMQAGQSPTRDTATLHAVS